MKKGIWGTFIIILLLGSLIGCTHEDETLFSTSTGSTTSVASISSMSPTITSQSPIPSSIESDVNLSKHYQLYVNGNDITDQLPIQIQKSNGYFGLPLLAIVKALGAEVDRQNSTSTHFVFAGQSYILDTLECTLVNENDVLNNHITRPPGNTASWSVVDNDLIIDNVTLRYALEEFNAKLEIDHQQSVIHIKTCT